MLVSSLLHCVVACGIEVVCDDDQAEEDQDDEDSDWPAKVGTNKEVLVSQDEVNCIAQIAMDCHPCDLFSVDRCSTASV